MEGVVCNPTEDCKYYPTCFEYRPLEKFKIFFKKLFKDIFVDVVSQFKVIKESYVYVITSIPYPYNIGVLYRHTLVNALFSGLRLRAFVKHILSTVGYSNVRHAVIKAVFVFVVNNPTFSSYKKTVKLQCFPSIFKCRLNITTSCKTPFVSANYTYLICVYNGLRFLNPIIVIKVYVRFFSNLFNFVFVKSGSHIKLFVFLFPKRVKITKICRNYVGSTLAIIHTTDFSGFLSNRFSFKASHFSHGISHLCSITRKVTR